MRATSQAAPTSVAAPAPPPRLRGLPLIGNLLQVRYDRLGTQLRLAALGDLSTFSMGPLRLLMVSSGALAHEVLVEKEAAFMKSRGLSEFARPLLGNGLLTSEKDEHRRQRRLLGPAFVPRRMAGYADVMVRATEAKMAGW